MTTGIPRTPSCWRWREMLERLRHDAFVGGDHEEREVYARRAGHHGPYEVLVTGNVHDTDDRAAAEVERVKFRSMVIPRRRSSASRSMARPVSASTRPTCHGRCGRQFRRSCGHPRPPRPELQRRQLGAFAEVVSDVAGQQSAMRLRMTPAQARQVRAWIDQRAEIRLGIRRQVGRSMARRAGEGAALLVLKARPPSTGSGVPSRTHASAPARSKRAHQLPEHPEAQRLQLAPGAISSKPSASRSRS